jgi:hypothetical protein
VIQSEAMATKKSIDIPIHTVRGQRVVLDSDLAALYGVTQWLQSGHQAQSETVPGRFFLRGQQ